MTDRKPWTSEQDTIILTLISKLGTSQWTAIACQMRTSCASSRSSKQIRERWYNQLSPNITRTPWSTQEQTLLFASHERLGNKWKDIAAQLPGRTDNAVKNHFYSTVRRAMRRMDKHFGFRESTKKIRNLKPAALTHLLEAASTLPDFSEMMDLLLKFAQWKPNRKSKQIQPEHSRQVYTKIIQMINAYNQNYERGRKIRNDDSLDGVKPQQAEIQHQNSNDNQSTVSDGEEEQGEENQSVNYFGRAEQPPNWFSIQEKDYQLDLCVKGLGLLCEEDNYE